MCRRLIHFKRDEKINTRWTEHKAAILLIAVKTVGLFIIIVKTLLLRVLWHRSFNVICIHREKLHNKSRLSFSTEKKHWCSCPCFSGQQIINISFTVLPFDKNYHNITGVEVFLQTICVAWCFILVSPQDGTIAWRSLQ